MAEKLITVFGGAGFVGRHLVPRLAQQGWRIRIAARHPNETLFLKPAGNPGQIQAVLSNIRDPDSTARALEGAAAAVNLVGILAPGGHQTFDAVHVDGAANIAQAAAAAGLSRLVHVSALGADRDAEAAYAVSKAKGEAAAQKAFRNTTVLRPSIVFGPEDDFFNRFAGLARLFPALPLIGGGHTRFQPVYVGDVADAICAALNKDSAPGQTYELGGPRTYSFRDILAYILAQTGRSRLLVPLPFFAAKILAATTGWLPGAPITLDQVRLLEHDNVVSENALGLAGLGVAATPVESIVPTYLKRFRRAGQFSETRA